MKSGSGGPGHEALEEAVPEGVKNIVLVMANAGYLVAPPPQGKDARGDGVKEMWDATSWRMERFLPGMVGDGAGVSGLRGGEAEAEPEARGVSNGGEKRQEHGDQPEQEVD